MHPQMSNTYITHAEQYVPAEDTSRARYLSVLQWTSEGWACTGDTDSREPARDLTFGAMATLYPDRHVYVSRDQPNHIRLQLSA